jgi:hypothetical protein
MFVAVEVSTLKKTASCFITRAANGQKLQPITTSVIHFFVCSITCSSVIIKVKLTEFCINLQVSAGVFKIVAAY